MKGMELDSGDSYCCHHIPGEISIRLHDELLAEYMNGRFLVADNSLSLLFFLLRIKVDAPVCIDHPVAMCSSALPSHRPIAIPTHFK
jgi:hypothetical protein